MNNTIKANTREILGKKVESLRKEGKLPAVLFESNGTSLSITIDTKATEKLAKTATRTTILDIDVDGKVSKAIIKEIQTNPMTDDIQHVSFFKIDENVEMDFDVPIITTGIAPAVKNNLGILVQPISTINVRCKVKDLMPNFVVDISKLEHAGQTIKVSELGIPEHVKLVHAEDADVTAITITELQKAEEVVATVAAETAVEGEVAADAAKATDAKADKK